jgi:hypothetical protein
MINTLHLVFGDEPRPENTSGPCLKIKTLGWPDLERFEYTLWDFLRRHNNIRYLYNISLSGHPEVLALEKVVQSAISRIDKTLGTYDDAMLGLKNTFLNKDLILRCGDMSRARCSYKSAVILGAGPSLDEHWPFIKSLGKDVLLMACDVIYKRCLEEGVQPQVVCTSERVAATQAFMAGVPASETTMIATLMAYPETLAEWPGRLNFVVRKDNTAEWLPLKKRGPITSHASVVPNMVSIAGWHGVKDVLLLGVDLCFKDGISHANFGKSLAEEQAKIQKIETSRKDLEIDCYDGVKRPTTPTWLIMRQAIYHSALEHNIQVFSGGPTSGTLYKSKYMEPTFWLNHVKKGGFFTPESLNKYADEESYAWNQKQAKAISELKRVKETILSKDLPPKNIVSNPTVKALCFGALHRDYIKHINDEFKHGTSTTQFKDLVLRAIDDVCAIMN